MKTFGLVGFPLTHSWSAEYFSRKFRELNLPDHEYRLYPIQSVEKILDILSGNPSLLGLNVTIPHKVAILPFLDELSTGAQEVGAVNCINVIRNSGKTKLIGYNTDVFGFTLSLERLIQPHHTHALVLGTGGASKAVVYALKQMGIRHTLVSRCPSHVGIISYEDLTKPIIADHSLIINTTPASMFPAVSGLPEIPYEFLSSRHLLFDLVYNPEETLFLRKGREAGATIKNGLEMLQLQAERSWEIWCGE